MFNGLREFSMGCALLVLSATGFGQTYQVISFTNGGTLSGTVKWSGPVPHQASAAINKDTQICDPESHKTRDLERLIIGPQGGVASTVVFLKDISRGKAIGLRVLGRRRSPWTPTETRP